MTKRCAFLIFSKSIASLLSPIYPKSMAYLVHFLVFLHEFLEVGPRIADLLLASVEDDLGKGRQVPPFDCSSIIFQIYYSNKIS